MKTEKFYAVLSLPEAYRHETNPLITLSIIGQVWQRWAAVIGARSDCFVSAVVTESIMATDSVPTEANVILVTGERNPATTKNPATYRQAVIDVLKCVGNELGQTSAKLTFRNVDSEWIDLTGQTEIPAAETLSE